MHIRPPREAGCCKDVEAPVVLQVEARRQTMVRAHGLCHLCSPGIVLDENKVLATTRLHIFTHECPVLTHVDALVP